MTNVNILFVITSLFNGGAQLQLLNFIERLPSNINCQVVTIKSKGNLAEEFEKQGILVESLNFRNKYDIFKIAKLYRMIKNNNINVVFTVGFGDSLFWGRFIGKIAGVKLIYSSLHTIPFVNKYFKFPNNKINKFNTRFFPVSENIKRILIDEFNIRENKVSVLYNSFDIQKFDVNKIEISKKIKKISMVGEEEKIILHVGKLIYYKNQILTLQYMAKCPKVNVKCIFAGEGPDKEKIINIIKDYKLENRVFLIDHLSHLDCLYLINKADIVVLPSLTEGLPNVLIEAHLMKKPVVASDVGGVSEIVIHNQSGYIFDINNKEEFAKYLNNLLANEITRKKFGEKGFEIVSSKFNMKDKVNRFLFFLEKDLKEK